MRLLPALLVLVICVRNSLGFDFRRPLNKDNDILGSPQREPSSLTLARKDATADSDRARKACQMCRNSILCKDLKRCKGCNKICEGIDLSTLDIQESRSALKFASRNQEATQDVQTEGKPQAIQDSQNTESPQTLQEISESIQALANPVNPEMSVALQNPEQVPLQEGNGIQDIPVGEIRTEMDDQLQQMNNLGESKDQVTITSRFAEGEDMPQARQQVHNTKYRYFSLGSFEEGPAYNLVFNLLGIHPKEDVEKVIILGQNRGQYFVDQDMDHPLILDTARAFGDYKVVAPRIHKGRASAMTEAEEEGIMDMLNAAIEQEVEKKKRQLNEKELGVIIQAVLTAWNRKSFDKAHFVNSRNRTGAIPSTDLRESDKDMASSISQWNNVDARASEGAMEEQQRVFTSENQPQRELEAASQKIDLSSRSAQEDIMRASPQGEAKEKQGPKDTKNPTDDTEGFVDDNQEPDIVNQKINVTTEANDIYVDPILGPTGEVIIDGEHLNTRIPPQPPKNQTVQVEMLGEEQEGASRNRQNLGDNVMRIVESGLRGADGIMRNADGSMRQAGEELRRTNPGLPQLSSNGLEGMESRPDQAMARKNLEENVNDVIENSLRGANGIVEEEGPKALEEGGWRMKEGGWRSEEGGWRSAATPSSVFATTMEPPRAFEGPRGQPAAASRDNMMKTVEFTPSSRTLESTPEPMRPTQSLVEDSKREAVEEEGQQEPLMDLEARSGSFKDDQGQAQDITESFGEIVPARDADPSTGKVIFVGKDINLPLRMVKDKDGSFRFTVDTDKLCNCKNATCPKRHLVDIGEETIGESLLPAEQEEDLQELKRNRRSLLLNSIDQEWKPLKEQNEGSDELLQVGPEYKFENGSEEELEEQLDTLDKSVKKYDEENEKLLNKGTTVLIDDMAKAKNVQKAINLVNTVLSWMRDLTLNSSSPAVEQKS